MKRQLQKGHVLANLVLACTSICLTLGAAELVLRSIVPLDPRSPSEFRVPDPALGWVLEADANYVYQMPEAVVHVSYNSQGWHDVEHEVKKPDGVFRILILGDSFMEAYSVELEDAFPRRVEALARSAGSNTEVINAGVAGYGTLQEYLMFEENGQLYAPDLVLLGFLVANDLMNNSAEIESLLGPGRAQRDARPFLNPDEPAAWMIIPGDFDGAQRRYVQQREFLANQRAKLTERVIALRMLHETIRKIAKAEENPESGSSVEQRTIEAEELALLGVNYCGEPVEYTRAWDTTERILSRLKSDVEALGAQLVVFTVPGLEEVSLESYEAVNGRIAFPEKLCIEEAPGHQRLSQILTELDIEMIPLLPEFRRVMREDGALLYRLSDQHWNPDGHALAADLVVTELIKRDLLPISATQASPLP